MGVVGGWWGTEMSEFAQSLLAEPTDIMAWFSLGADLAIAAVLLVVALYIYFTSTFDFWKKKGVPGPRPLPLVGNFLSIQTGKASLTDVVGRFHADYKSKGFVGVFQTRTPALVIWEPETVKMMLTKDFSSLVDHGASMGDDVLDQHLFNLQGESWRTMRYKLAPVFTSGKLKLMFPLIKECSDQLCQVIRHELTKTDNLDVSGFLTRYTTDVIGTCAFGVECNSLKNADSQFHVMGRKVLKPNFWFQLRFLLYSIHPKIGKLLPVNFIFPGLENFFVNLIRETVQFREANGVVRNDFVNLMMQVKKKDETALSEGQEVVMPFTETLMAAQAFVFFLAGLDNIANTIGFCLYELALHKDIQDKLYQDLESTAAKNDGELDYSVIKENEYLDQVLNETLRKYTPAGVILRQVTAPQYQIHGTDIVLEKGTEVMIPVHAIHNDPEIYPDPQRFDPSRFAEEAKSERHPYTFLPFGEGPRFCIAQRFATLEMKLCIASLVRGFEFSPCAKTEIPVKLNTRTFGPTPVNGLWLKTVQRSAK